MSIITESISDMMADNETLINICEFGCLFYCDRENGRLRLLLFLLRLHFLELRQGGRQNSLSCYYLLSVSGSDKSRI